MHKESGEPNLLILNWMNYNADKLLDSLKKYEIESI